MAWSLQNFTTYTEVDPENELTVSSDEIVCVADGNNGEHLTHVYKDFGVGAIGDFQYKLKFRISPEQEGDQLASGCIWALTQVSLTDYDIYYINNDALMLNIYQEAWDRWFYLGSYGFDSAVPPDTVIISTDTWYYVLVTRVGSNVSLKVCSDATFETVLQEFIATDDRLFRYLFPLMHDQYDPRPFTDSTSAFRGSVSDLYIYELLQVATPTASPDAGSYDMHDTMAVTLSCATEDASIYYTLDGSTPDNGSTLYTEAITLSTTTFVKVIAYKTGFTTSAVASFTYVYADAEEAYPYYHTRIRSLLDELAMRLEDAEQRTYPKNVKLKALQRGQLEVAKFITDACVFDLQTIHSSLDCSSGEIALSSLTYNVLKDKEGLIRVKVTIGANTYWAVEIELKNLELLENEYFLDDDEVYFYVQNSKIKIVAQDLTGATADVFYVRIPTEFTVYQSPDLPAQYDNMILEMAENYCWAIEGRYDRAKAAKDIALREIAFLNRKREEQQQLINIGVTFDF